MMIVLGGAFIFGNLLGAEVRACQLHQLPIVAHLPLAQSKELAEPSEFRDYFSREDTGY